MKQDRNEAQPYVSRNAVGALAGMIEAVCAGFSEDNEMDTDAIVAAYVMVDELVAEIAWRGMGNRPNQWQLWLPQHRLGVERALKRIAQSEEVEHATVEKGLRDALGAREQ